MVKNMITSLWLILFVASNCLALEIIKYNGDKHIVAVSSNSVNRFIFPSDVTAKIYSKEKNIKIESNKNEVFVKYVPQVDKNQTLDEEGRPTSASAVLNYKKASKAELYVATETGTYLFILVPQNIEAETFKIIDEQADKKKAFEFETKDSYTKTLNKLASFGLDIATGYSKNIPEGFLIKQLSGKPFKYGHDFTLTPSYKISGDYFEVYVFELKNNTAAEKFVEPSFFKSIPIAKKHSIAALDETIFPFQKSYIVIVSERKASELKE